MPLQLQLHVIEALNRVQRVDGGEGEGLFCQKKETMVEDEEEDLMIQIRAKKNMMII